MERFYIVALTLIFDEHTHVQNVNVRVHVHVCVYKIVRGYKRMYIIIQGKARQMGSLKAINK